MAPCPGLCIGASGASESGQPVQKVLTGSMNPGQSAVKNDENLNLITDPRVVSRYVAMYEAVRDGKEITNDFDPSRAINVMFTPAKGHRVTDRIFKWIDQEKEAIFLSVFTLRNLTTPSERRNLVEKLAAAKKRGVKVVVLTDHKQADGVDAKGNTTFYDDWTDDKLEKAGIPVYECLNPAGNFNAMHAKCAVFGLNKIKVITDTGNWTKAALGNWKNNSKQNEESYLFLDTNKLDDNRTGLRYLGNWLHLLRKYAPQSPDEKPAEELISELVQHKKWPRIKVDFSVMAKTFAGQEVFVTGNHPSIGNWMKDGPGLKLDTGPGTYPTWQSDGSLELPFGTKFEYKLVKKGSDGELEWEKGENAMLIVDPTDPRHAERHPSQPYRQIKTDAF